MELAQGDEEKLGEPGAFLQQPRAPRWRWGLRVCGTRPESLPSVDLPAGPLIGEGARVPERSTSCVQGGGLPWQGRIGEGNRMY